jgi:hypothetical protein
MVAFWGGDPKLIEFLADLTPRGWFYDNQLAINQYIDRLLAEVDASAERFTPNPAVRDFARIRSGSSFHRAHYALFILTVPTLEHSVERSCRMHIRVRQAQTACVLEQYRRAHGSYPEILEKLVPEYLTAVPPDVMSGEPMRYRIELGGRFTLYSVGTNQKDDGGKIDPKARQNKHLDWVWTYPPPAPAPPAP